MRALAETILTTTAITAGMASASVMDEPEKQTILLPMPRLELQYLPQEMVWNYRRIKTWPHPDTPETHRMARFRLYQTGLTVRVMVRGDDEAWLASFVKSFIVTLPRKMADEDQNLVTIEVNKAVRGGFGTRSVEVFKKRNNALYVYFGGMICRDVEEALITDVDVESGIIWR